MRRRRESGEKVLAMSSGAGFSLRIETQWIGDKKKYLIFYYIKKAGIKRIFK